MYRIPKFSDICFFEKKFVRNQKSSKVLVINVVSDQFLAETVLTDFLTLFWTPDFMTESVLLRPFKKYVTSLGVRGVKQNSDKQWQVGEGGQAKQWCHRSWENFVTVFKTIDFLW